MKLKKVLMVLLAMMLIMSTVAGCSKKTEVEKDKDKDTTTSNQTTDTASDDKEEPQEQQVLELAVFEGGYGRDYWDACVEAFEKDYPYIDVELNISPQIVDIIRPRIVAGDPPDYISAGDLDTQMLGDGALLPISDVFESESLDGTGILKDKILPGFLEDIRRVGGGELYFAPTNMTVLGMFYNKGLFDEKGWEAPTTWDEFIKFEDKAKETNRALYTYQGIYPVYNQFYLAGMLGAHAGMDEVSKILNYEEDAWESPKVKEVLGAFAQLTENDRLLEGTVAMNHTQAQTAFLQGQAMFIPCGTWFEGEMKDVEKEEGFEFGFMPGPKLDADDTQHLVASVERHYIPLMAKNPDAAKLFMKYQYTPEMIALRAKHGGAVMPVVDGVELAKEYISPAMYNAFSAFEKYDATSMTFDWKVVPNTEIQVFDEFWNAINSLMNNDTDLEGWLARVKEANKKIRKTMLEQEQE